MFVELSALPGFCNIIRPKQIAWLILASMLNLGRESMCVTKKGGLPHDNMTRANSDQQTLRTKKTKRRIEILKVHLTAWNIKKKIAQ